MDICLLLKVRENIGKSISENLSGKYSQKRLDHAKRSATDALKTNLKWVIQNTEEATGDLIANRTANKMTKVSNNSQQNDSETVINKNAEEIPKEKYISPEKRQEIIDD